MKKGLLKLLVFVGLCLVLWWCRTPLQTGRQSIEKLEIPAYTEASYKKHLIYEGYEVVLNENYRIPEWVAYELTDEEVSGTNPRSNHFRTDPNFNGLQADDNDYRNSGWDRGHMAPAMDMRWDKTAMKQCFYMTNMCPQDTKLNNDHWRVLEEKVHRWAKRDKRLMVYTGPIMGKTPKLIGKNKQDIAVPDAFFKVVYAPDQGRAIAFIYPNTPCPGGIKKYAVTVAEVERRTGLTFSSAIPKRPCNIDDWE